MFVVFLLTDCKTYDTSVCFPKLQSHFAAYGGYLNNKDRVALLFLALLALSAFHLFILFPFVVDYSILCFDLEHIFDTAC